MPQIPSLRRWLVPVAVLLAAVRCGGGDSLTLPSEKLPAHITLEAGDAQTGTAGIRLTDTLSVLITNSKDEAVPTVKVVFQLLAGGTGGDLIPDTAVTDINGHAKSVWLLGRLAGPQSVQARVIGQVAGPPLNLTIRATAVAGAPDTVFAALGDLQSGSVGNTLTDSLAVLVTDQFANPVAGQTVNWTVPAGQGSVSAATAVTGADGRAAVTRRLGLTTGTQTALATIGGVAGSPVTFTSTATAGGAVRAVKLFGDNQTAPASFQLTDSIVVQVQDVNGNGVPGRNVNWVVTDGGSVTPLTSVTDAQGMAFAYWTLKPTAGANQLTAAAAGLAQLQFSATGTSATPAHLLAQSSTSIAGTAGLNVGQNPSVKVTDANSNPVQGVTVTFLVTAGGGSVSDGTGSGSSVSVATNTSGVATLTSWTLGQVAGIANTVTATAAATGVSGNPVTFNATAAPGAATQLLITTQPSANAQSGAVLGQQPVVQLRDVFGNAVSQANVQVTAAIIGAGAVLRGTATVPTSASGIASFSGLNLFGATGAYSLGFSASGLTPDTSSVITLAAGAASQLVITTQPSASAQSGVAFGTQPVLQVQDAAGNPVATGGIQVTASIATGGGSLGGTTTVSTAGNGSASYTNLAITGAPGARTLSFTATGLTAAVSGTVTLGAGAPTQLGVATQPSASAQSGSVLAQQPVIVLQDAIGNTVPQAGVSVTATITGAPAGVTLGGSATVVTAASGAASFAGLSLTGPSGNYTLSFSASAVAGVTSSAIALAAGSGTTLTITTQPPATGQSGVALAPAPVIQLRDGVGNAVNQSGVAVVATIATGASGTLTGSDTALTNASGVATFSNLVISGAVGSYTLAFNGTGLTGVTATPTLLSAGPAAKLALLTQPAVTAQSGIIFTTQPVLQLQDAAGNPLSQAGVVVTAAIASGGGTIGGTLTATTGANGQASYT
ncbi:MAG: Ig-like domain-containing protein, partial [Gemmatimonadota bacterium]